MFELGQKSNGAYFLFVAHYGPMEAEFNRWGRGFWKISFEFLALYLKKLRKTRQGLTRLMFP